MKFGKNQTSQKLLFVSGLSLLALVATGWTNKLNRPLESMEHATLREDSQYMSQLLRTRSSDGVNSMPVDLSDTRQHRFVVSRLRAAGKTPKNSPYLFERLEQMRARALNRVGGGKGEVTTAGVGDWCEHIIYMSNERGTTTTTYTVSPGVSCKNGANYVYTDILAYNSNTTGTDNIPLASAAGEDYSGGTDFTSELIIEPVVPAGTNRVLSTNSMMVAMDGNGNEQITYTDIMTASTVQKQGISLTNPREIAGGAGSQIQICQLRGGTDCDYAVSGYSNGNLVAYPAVPTHVSAAQVVNNIWSLNPGESWAMPAAYNYQRVYLPLTGTYDAGADTTSGGVIVACRITRYDSAKLRLQLVNTGQKCYVETDLRSRLATGVRYANFNFLADFSYFTIGNDPACKADTIVNESVKLWIDIQAWADCGKGEVRRFTSTTHDKKPVLDRFIYYRNSCMAEGTPILRADGKPVAIEQLKVGEKVIANSEGLLLTVVGTDQGNEAKPFVRLRDDAGHDIRLTEQHPVKTASGKVVPAASVKVNDQLMTQGGISTVTLVERLPPRGKVYNLTLGTPEELEKVGQTDRTMFAGGFLVGDKTMQVELETPRREQPSELLAALPKVWHRDYLNRPVLKADR